MPSTEIIVKKKKQLEFLFHVLIVNKSSTLFPHWLFYFPENRPIKSQLVKKKLEERETDGGGGERDINRENKREKQHGRENLIRQRVERERDRK